VLIPASQELHFKAHHYDPRKLNTVYVATYVPAQHYKEVASTPQEVYILKASKGVAEQLDITRVLATLHFQLTHN